MNPTAPNTGLGFSFRRNYMGYNETPTKGPAMKKLDSLGAFLVKHRAFVASGLTATAFLILMYRNARQLETFMKDHNLLDEYTEWLTDGL